MIGITVFGYCKASKLDTLPKLDYSNSTLYHIGYLQLLGSNDGKFSQTVNESSFFSFGIPFGVGRKLSHRTSFDFEVVTIINPYFNTGKPLNLHVLLHPGIIFNLGKNWNIGNRLAFETGSNQVGLTPLINKSIMHMNNKSLFFELVFPLRYGPKKASSYLMLYGIHVGFQF